jgi:hypothetical protein
VYNVYADPSYRDKLAESRRKAIEEGRFTSWNKGLTKETNEKVASASKKAGVTLHERYVTGSLINWRISDPDKGAEAAHKSSLTKRAQFASGELSGSWNKGLTKETSVALMKIGRNISKSYDRREIKQRFSIEEFDAQIAAHSDKFELITDPLLYRSSKRTILEFKCKNCGATQFKTLVKLNNTPRCFECMPKASIAQIEIFEFVESLGFNTILNDRKTISPLELDVYVPSSSFAIEFNGLYWHSRPPLNDEFRMQKKLNTCKKVGIDLLNVFEDEWEHHQEIIESLIATRLHIYRRTFSAKELNVVILNTNDAKSFFDENHLECYVPTTITFALQTIDGEIVAAMSLKRLFHKEINASVEIARACSSMNCHVFDWVERLSEASLNWSQQTYGIDRLTIFIDERIDDVKQFSPCWTQIGAEQTPRSWITNNKSRLEPLDENYLSKHDKKIFGCVRTKWSYPRFNS